MVTAEVVAHFVGERVLEEAVAGGDAVGGVDARPEVGDTAGAGGSGQHQVHEVGVEGVAGGLGSGRIAERAEVVGHVRGLHEPGQFPATDDPQRRLHAAASVGGVGVGDALGDERLDLRLAALRHSRSGRVIDVDIDDFAVGHHGVAGGIDDGRRIRLTRRQRRQFNGEPVGIQFVDDRHAVAGRQPEQLVAGLHATGEDVALPGERDGAVGIAGNAPHPRLMAEHSRLEALEHGRQRHVIEQVEHEERVAIAGLAGGGGALQQRQRGHHRAGAHDQAAGGHVGDGLGRGRCQAQQWRRALGQGGALERHGQGRSKDNQQGHRSVSGHYRDYRQRSASPYPCGQIRRCNG